MSRHPEGFDPDLGFPFMSKGNDVVGGFADDDEIGPEMAFPKEVFEVFAVGAFF